MTRADMVYSAIVQNMPIGYDAVEDAGVFIVLLFILFCMFTFGGRRKYPPDYPPYNNRRPPSNYPPFW